MASSTRKWRKQQKEYARRKRQATRRREEKRKENRLSTVLGLTGAQGFGKNILSQVLATTKLTHTNYLTNTLRKKRLNAAKAKFFKGYQNYYGSRLAYAVEKNDPFAVKLVLQEPETTQEHKNSCLQVVLYRIISILEKDISRKRYFTIQQIERMEEENRAKLNVRMEIFDLLFKSGATIGLKELHSIWSTGTFVYEFLDAYPQLIQQSLSHQNELLQSLQEKLDQTEDDIYWEQQEFHRGENGGYGFVPAHLRDEEILQQMSLETFQAFVESSGESTLTVE